MTTQQTPPTQPAPFTPDTANAQLDNVQISGGASNKKAEEAKRKGLQQMDAFLKNIVLNKVLQKYTIESLPGGDPVAAKALNAIYHNLQSLVPEIVANYGEHLDAIGAFPGKLNPLEPEEFVALDWSQRIVGAIEPSKTYRNAAGYTIDALFNEMDSLLAGQAYVAQQRADRKTALKELISERKNLISRLSMNKNLIEDSDARNVLDIAQARLTEAETVLVNEYNDTAMTELPQDFLNRRLPQYMSTVGIETGIAVPQTSADDAVNAIFNGAKVLNATNLKAKADKEFAAKNAPLIDKTPKGPVISIDKGQAATVNAIREQFPDRPDLALKAEVAYLNAKQADAKADPNIYVQQFAGQAEGEKRIAQGLFDSGLDTSKLPPEVAKLVMEKGLTADTLPALVAELPAFKTQYPTAVGDKGFGGKEIAQSIIDKAMKEQPGNPMLSITAQLQPSPSNPNAPITGTYADFISKQAQELDVSPTGLAKAYTGDTTTILAEQNVKRNQETSVYAELARKLQVSQQINDAVLKRFLPAGEAGRLPDDMTPEHFIGTKFQSGEADYKSYLGDFAKAKLPAGWDKISQQALQQYTASLPEPPTAAELAAEEAKKLAKLKVAKV